MLVDSATPARLQRVLDFRKSIEEEKTHFYNTFDDKSAYRHLLLRLLGRWLLDHKIADTLVRFTSPAVSMKKRSMKTKLRL